MKPIAISAYPFLAGVVPVMIYYNISASNEVGLDGLIMPLGVVLGLVAFFYLLPALCLPRFKASENAEPRLALFVTLVWLILYSPGFFILLAGFCASFALPFNPLGYAAQGLPLAWLVLLGVFMAGMDKRLVKPFAKFTGNAFGFLFLLEVLCMGYHEVLSQGAAMAAREAVIGQLPQPLVRHEQLKARLSNEPLPDVYYIILDEMASTDVLKKYLAYDNTAVVNGYEKAGFYVARNSLSNYPLTRLSLSSSLNMNYLEACAGKVGKRCEDWRATEELIRNSAVAGAFQKGGYHYIHVDSRTTPSNHSYMADENIDCGYVDPLFEKLLRSTTIALLPGLEPFLAEREREHVLRQFAAVESMAGKQSAAQNRSKPVFIFAHVLCPHEPFIFAEDGGPAMEAGTRIDNQWDGATRAAYVGQAKFVQNRALACVKAIIAAGEASGRPSIIIVQGDHGTHCSDYVSREKPSAALLGERYGIFNAYFLPRSMTGKLTDNIEPVNTFRLVLSNLFEIDLPALPNRQYYATYAHPFNQSIVTVPRPGAIESAQAPPCDPN